MRIALLLAAGALLAGCPGSGDHDHVEDAPPLAHTGTVAIVAAPGDDLRYLGADLVDATANLAGGLTVVYINAPRAHGTEVDAQAVIEGYASFTSFTLGTWSCGALTVADHVVEHCRPGNGGNLSLVFLDLPPDSVLPLWDGTAPSAASTGIAPTTYDQRGLVATVAGVLAATTPTTIRTLELSATHGDERADPMMAGAVAMLAWAAHPSAELYAYRADSAAAEPANVPQDATQAPFGALAACGPACALDAPTANDSVMRRYAVGFRHPATGKLRADNPAGQCMSATSGGMVTLEACATAPDVTLRADGQIALALAAGDVCLQVLPTGEVVATACGSTSANDHLALDDDGHLWTGIPPVAAAGQMAYAHLDCVLISGGRPRAGRCGKDLAPRWTLAPEPVATPRAGLDLPETGRAVRLGDVTGDGRADLCAIHAGRLACATGKADGTFAPAVPVDEASAPLDVAPESLALGDVDLDGVLDACGRNADGVSCAESSEGLGAVFPDAVFVRAAGTGGPAEAADLAFAIVAAAPHGSGPTRACTRADDGLDCAKLEGSSPHVVGPPTDPEIPAFLAQLDANDAPDWCVAQADGPVCGLGGKTAGALWGYSFRNTVEGRAPEAATYELAALVDVDGDDRADLCSLHVGTIVCAPSQGRAFGPRSTRLILPAGFAPTGLWATAGKLCASDATTIFCTP